MESPEPGAAGIREQVRDALICEELRRLNPESNGVLIIGSAGSDLIHRLSVDGWDPGRLDTTRSYNDLSEDERRSVSVLVLSDFAEPDGKLPNVIRNLLNAFPRVAWVVSTTPARTELREPDHRRGGFGIRFDRPQMRLLGEQCSLQTVRCRYFLRALYPVDWIGARLGWSRINPPAIAGSWMETFLVWDARLLPGGLAGPSLITVFRRRLEIEEPVPEEGVIPAPIVPSAVCRS